MTRYSDEMKLDYAGLAWNFHVNPASCGNPLHYEQYLAISAISDNQIGFSKTHVFIEESENEPTIVGFISLRCTSVVITSEDGSLLGHAALEIYELAVDMNHEREGVGTALIDLAILIANEINSHNAGVEYITLYADPKSVDFYVKMNFELVGKMYAVPNAQSNRDCIPMMMKLF